MEIFEYRIFTRDDVVTQRLEFGSAFLSFSLESKIALFFLTFPYPVSIPKNFVIFISLSIRPSDGGGGEGGRERKA